MSDNVTQLFPRRVQRDPALTPPLPFHAKRVDALPKTTTITTAMFLALYDVRNCLHEAVRSGALPAAVQAKCRAALRKANETP